MWVLFFINADTLFSPQKLKDCLLQAIILYCILVDVEGSIDSKGPSVDQCVPLLSTAFTQMYFSLFHSIFDAVL